MSTTYPSTLDSGTNLFNARASTDLIPPSDHNDLANAIIAIETKLGTGASVPNTAGYALLSTGSGGSAWQALPASYAPGGSDVAIGDGGTGASTPAAARTNLGAAASGANSDITSLTGTFTTPLTKAQGGTGTSTGVLAPRVVALTDAATITINADTTDIGAVTIAGNRTLANPTGTFYDGQKLELRVTQDATGSRTLSYGTAFAFSAAAPQPTLTTTASATDILGFRYVAALSKFRYYGMV